MASEIVVRPLSLDDQSDWARLWSGYLAFYETSVPEEIYRTTWARLTSDAPDEFNGLIALDPAGRAVGLAHYLFHRHCWRVENVCYLQDLFVDADARGSGVGEALLDAVYAAADAAEAPSVYWLTQTYNERARRLYDRKGAVTAFVKYTRG